MVNTAVAERQGLKGELYNIMVGADRILQVIKLPSKEDYTHSDQGEEEEQD